MTDLQQRPYVPAKQLNTKYPVSDPQWVNGNELTGFCSSLTVIRTYLMVLLPHRSDSCPAILSESSNMRDLKTM